MKQISRQYTRALRLSKRGVGGDAFEIGNKLPYLMLIAITLTIALFVISFTFDFYNAYKIVVPDETYINTYITRFLYSPDCFSSEGQFFSGGSKTFLLDASKFNQQQLDSCYQTSAENIYSFRLSFRPDDPSYTLPSIQTLTYSGRPLTTLQRYVLVQFNEELIPGTLHIEIEKR